MSGKQPSDDNAANRNGNSGESVKKNELGLDMNEVESQEAEVNVEERRVKAETKKFTAEAGKFEAERDYFRKILRPRIVAALLGGIGVVVGAIGQCNIERYKLAKDKVEHARGIAKLEEEKRRLESDYEELRRVKIQLEEDKALLQAERDVLERDKADLAAGKKELELTLEELAALGDSLEALKERGAPRCIAECAQEFRRLGKEYDDCVQMCEEESSSD